MSQPTIDEGTRASINAMLAGHRAYKALSTRAGVANTTVGDAFRCPALTERAVRQPLEPTAEVVLQALGVGLDLGAETEVAEILERYCSGHVCLTVDHEDAPTDSTPREVRDAALTVTASLAEVVTSVREAVADNRIDATELRRIRAAVTGLSADLGRLVAEAEAASDR